jgi:hypothetical protein
MRRVPIHIGDCFISSNGTSWEVTCDYGFGRVDLYCKEKHRAMMTTKEQLRSSGYWSKAGVCERKEGGSR